MYDKVPPVEWSLGAGLTILGFGVLTVAIGVLMMIPTFWSGMGGILALSAVIVAVSLIFQLGMYDNSPNTDWALGAGLTILGFGVLTTVIGLFTLSPTFWTGMLGVLAIAALIVATSLILQLGKYNKYPTFDWIKGVGLSMVSFGGAALLLGAAILTFVGGLALAAGLIGILALAGTIMAVDYIFSNGGFARYPTDKWIQGVSSSLLGFGKSAVKLIVDIFKAFGPAAPVLIAAGVVAMIALAGSMLAVDKIFSKGGFKIYPSKEWVNGVSLALSTFSQIKLGDGGLIDYVASVAKSIIGGYSSLAQEMVDVSLIFASGNYTSYPSDAWVTGVSAALTKFSQISIGGGGFWSTAASVVKTKVFSVYSSLAKEMADVSLIFAKGNFSNVPDANYVKNLSSFLTSMSKIVGDGPSLLDMGSFSLNMKMLGPALAAISIGTQNTISDLYLTNFQKLINLISTIPDKSKEIRNLANSFSDLADSLRQINVEGLSSLSSSLVLLSVVDDARLQVVLDKVKKNENTLKTVQGENSGIASIMANFLTNNPAEAEKIQNLSEKKLPTPKDYASDSYKVLNSINDKLSQLLDTIEKPSQSSSFYE
jgi:hypothetical protein